MAEDKQWESATPKYPQKEDRAWEDAPTSKEPPLEPGLEPVGLEEYFIPGLKGYTAAIGAGKLLEQAGKVYGKDILKGVGKSLVPTTGKELAAGAVLSSLGGAAAIKGEELVPARHAKYKPYVGMALPLALGVGGTMAYNLGRGAVEGLIPEERIAAGRLMKKKGAKPSYEQMEKGAESQATKGKLRQQQRVANESYNEALGLPRTGFFGEKEFRAAKNSLNNEYDDVLKNQNVTFKRDFFDSIDSILKNEQSLQGTGISFGQSKALINALQKVSSAGKLPADLQSRINRLGGVSEKEISPEDSREALSILNELLPQLKAQPDVTMPATAYNEIRSILGDAAARTGDNRQARLLRTVQGLFDNAADTSLPTQIAQRLRMVRLRWEALKTLEEAQLKSGETGIIPPEAVGKAIQDRIDQGSIYGSNNLLFDIGRAGQQLGISKPATGKEMFRESQRGLTPHSTAWGVIRDILGLPMYPIRSAQVTQRLTPKAPPEQAARRAMLPAGAAAAAGYGKLNNE